MKNWKIVKTWKADIYIAADICLVKQICQKICFKNSLCVTIENCDFVYTGGKESGCKIGLVNYPRFPADHKTITQKAKKIALQILEETYQWSVLIVTPQKTFWFSKKPNHRR